MPSTLDNYVNLDRAVDDLTDWGSNLDGGSPNIPTVHMPLVSDITAPRNILALVPTFARNSIGTYEDVSNVIQTATANNPRFEDGKYLCEDNTTNILKHNRDFNTAGVNWVANGVLTYSADSTVAPDGTTTADTLGDNDATKNASFYQLFATVNGTQQVYDIFVKKNISASTFPGLGLSIDGTGTTIQIALDITDGTSTVRSSSSAPDFIDCIEVGDYYHYAIGFTPVVTEAGALALIYPAVNTDASDTWVTAVTGTAIFWGVGMSSLGYLTSTIPTVAATVERLDDVLTLTPSPSTTGFTIYMEIEPLVDFADIDNAKVRLFGSADSGTDEIRTIGAGSWSYTVSGGGGFFAVNKSDFVKGTTYKVAFSVQQVGGNEVAYAYLDGVAKVSGSSAAGTLDHSDTDMTLGYLATGVQGSCPFKVKDWGVWEYGKSGQDLGNLTG
jgi:hypothetical protein